MAPILQVENLRVYYHTHAGPVRAVENVSFTLQKGERLGLVGESGSGKSTMVLALLRMLKSPARIEAGRVLLGDTDLLQLSNAQMRAARFSQIALIPQGAMNSLNPVMRIKAQIADTIRYHRRNGNLSQAAITTHIHELLESVGLERRVAEMYPHELSGGMKQRVCIALGISLQPQVILADEPTSALDVVVQRQVMETLGKVQEEIGASLILVGHDMGLMAQFVNTIGVMYAGKLVEVGPVDAIFEEPLHPYTQLLIGSIPSLEGKGIFRGIPGITPSLLNPPSGCMFHPRCPQALTHCQTQVPTLQEVRPGHWVSCLLYANSPNAE
ncbi:MAG: ABC transporter ATP-binding protein [Caldilineaceae bacterium]|nr:ABC transporter ATP-binding protein [Caldilineaceae bacterium]